MSIPLVVLLPAAVQHPLVTVLTLLSYKQQLINFHTLNDPIIMPTFPGSISVNDTRKSAAQLLHTLKHLTQTTVNFIVSTVGDLIGDVCDKLSLLGSFMNRTLLLLLMTCLDSVPCPFVGLQTEYQQTKNIWD